MTALASLRSHLASFGNALLGYSGGVDSALLAVAGTQALGSERFLAVIGRSDSYPEDQYATAMDIARRFQVPLLEVATAEMADPDYLANPTNRCYFCRRALWEHLSRIAVERGFDVIIDGTNVDDLTEHRPGRQAGTERSIRSPLAQLRWTKAMVREASRELGIPNADAPSSPCLSSRVAYGLRITPARLRQVEEAESYLRSLGVAGDLRVRHHGDRARLEVEPRHFSTLHARWDEVRGFFTAAGFTSVELDPAGYRRGSLLAAAPAESQ